MFYFFTSNTCVKTCIIDCSLSRYLPKITKFNITYRNSNFQSSLDNTIFDQCHFENCTFRRLFISHVLFHNSSFKYTEFTNVKTSRTEFRNSTLDYTKYVQYSCIAAHAKNQSTILFSHSLFSSDDGFTVSSIRTYHRTILIQTAKLTIRRSFVWMVRVIWTLIIIFGRQACGKRI